MKNVTKGILATLIVLVLVTIRTYNYVFGMASWGLVGTEQTVSGYTENLCLNPE